MRAQRLGYTDFKDSDDWLMSWKRRYDVRVEKKNGLQETSFGGHAKGFESDRKSVCTAAADYDDDDGGQ